MAVARGLITKEMGLKDGDLDGKEWKKVVKEEVTTALVCSEISELCSRIGHEIKWEEGGRGRRLMSRKNRNHRNPSLNRSRNPRRSPSLRQSLSLNPSQKLSLSRRSMTKEPIRKYVPPRSSVCPGADEVGG
jgi:hypothetical protein